MPSVVRYFWFPFAVAMAVNVFIWRRRLLVAVDCGRATRAEVDAFVRWLGIWFVGGGMAIGLTELAAVGRRHFARWSMADRTRTRLRLVSHMRRVPDVECSACAGDFGCRTVKQACPPVVGQRGRLTKA